MKDKTRIERFEIMIPEKHVIESVRKTTYFFDGKEYGCICNIFAKLFKRQKTLYIWLGLSDEAIAKFGLLRGSGGDDDFTTECTGFSNFLKLMGYPVETDPDADIKFYLDLLHDQEGVRKKVKRVFELKKTLSTKKIKVKLVAPRREKCIIKKTTTYKTSEKEWDEVTYEVNGEECIDIIDAFHSIFPNYGEFCEWIGLPIKVLSMLGIDPANTNFYTVSTSRGFDFVLYRLGYKKYEDFYIDVLDNPSKVRAEIKKYFV